MGEQIKDLPSKYYFKTILNEDKFNAEKSRLRERETRAQEAAGLGPALREIRGGKSRKQSREDSPGRPAMQGHLHRQPELPVQATFSLPVEVDPRFRPAHVTPAARNADDDINSEAPSAHDKTTRASENKARSRSRPAAHGSYVEDRDWGMA